MLYDEPVLYFKGLTIFRDFSQDDRFYFHPPEAPRIARSAEGGNDYAMRLVLYRPDPNFPAPQGFENGVLGWGHGKPPDGIEGEPRRLVPWHRNAARIPRRRLRAAGQERLTRHAMAG